MNNLIKVKNKSGLVHVFEDMKMAESFVNEHNKKIDSEINDLYIEVSKFAPCTGIDVDNRIYFECKYCKECLCEINQKKINDLQDKILSIVNQEDEQLKMFLDMINIRG